MVLDSDLPSACSGSTEEIARPLIRNYSYELGSTISKSCASMSGDARTKMAILDESPVPLPRKFSGTKIPASGFQWWLLFPTSCI